MISQSSKCRLYICIYTLTCTYIHTHVHMYIGMFSYFYFVLLVCEVFIFLRSLYTLPLLVTGRAYYVIVALHYVLASITKTRLFKYIENFTAQNWKFSNKNSNIFHISAQNIDCGYSLEPPRRGGSMFSSRNKVNNIYPCKLQFYYVKVGFKVVKIL